MARREQKKRTESEDITSGNECIRNALKMRQRLTGKPEFKFEIGKISASENVLDQMDKTPDGSFANFVWESFARHCLCDWGDVSQKDQDSNNQAIKTGGALFSTYNHDKHPTICISTDADRSETAIGLECDFCEDCSWGTGGWY